MKETQINTSQPNENIITLCDDAIKTIVDLSAVNTVAKLQVTNKFFQNSLREDLAKKKLLVMKKQNILLKIVVMKF